MQQCRDVAATGTLPALSVHGACMHTFRDNSVSPPSGKDANEGLDDLWPLHQGAWLTPQARCVRHTPSEDNAARERRRGGLWLQQ